MFDIPPGARHVFIQEDEASPHILGKWFTWTDWPLSENVDGNFLQKCYTKLTEHFR